MPVSLTMLQGSLAGPIARPPTPSPPVQLPRTPLETPPILPTTEEDDSEDAKDIGTEQMSEVEHILQDLANGVADDETFPRLPLRKMLPSSLTWTPMRL